MFWLVIGGIGSVIAIFSFFRIDAFVLSSKLKEARLGDKPTSREALLLGFTVLSLVACAIGLWKTSHQVEPPIEYLQAYGNNSNNGILQGQLTVDTSTLQSKAHAYKLAGVVIKYAGFQDILDTQPIEKSAPFDITPQTEQISIPYTDPTFKTRPGGLNYFQAVTSQRCNARPVQHTPRSEEGWGVNLGRTFVWRHLILAITPFRRFLGGRRNRPVIVRQSAASNS